MWFNQTIYKHMENMKLKVIKGLTVLSVGLFLLLFCLKLDGFVTWSWWIITAPIWVPFALALIIVIAAFVILNYIAKQESKL